MVSLKANAMCIGTYAPMHEPDHEPDLLENLPHQEELLLVTAPGAIRRTSNT